MKKYIISFSVLFLAGCGAVVIPSEEENSQVEDVPQPTIDRVQTYLEESSLLSAPKGEKVKNVCSYENLAPGKYANEVQVWALCEQFTADEHWRVTSGAGISVPVKIWFANPSKHWIPRNGSEYMPSIKEIFSEEAVAAIPTYQGNVQNLGEKNQERAERLFDRMRPYEVTEVLSDMMCKMDGDCELPMDYAIRSNCPYSMRCIEKMCTVVCPEF